MTPILQIKVAT